MSPRIKSALRLVRAGHDPEAALQACGYAQPARELQRYRADIAKAQATHEASLRRDPITELRRVCSGGYAPAARVAAAKQLLERTPPITSGDISFEWIIDPAAPLTLSEMIASREPTQVDLEESADTAMALDTLHEIAGDQSAPEAAQVTASRAILGRKLAAAAAEPTGLILPFNNRGPADHVVRVRSAE